MIITSNIYREQITATQVLLLRIHSADIDSHLYLIYLNCTLYNNSLRYLLTHLSDDKLLPLVTWPRFTDSPLNSSPWKQDYPLPTHTHTHTHSCEV